MSKKLKYYFIIDNEKVLVIDWKDFILSSDMRLILITDNKNYINFNKYPTCQNDLQKIFIHIEIFDFEVNTIKSNNEITSYIGSCFEELKLTIEKLKIKYIKSHDEFYIASIAETAGLDCARLREFFNVPGSKLKDILRFFNKEQMKQHLLSKGIARNLIPKYVKFDQNCFITDREKYINNIIDKFKLPMFVKPISGTGSLGICKLENKDQLIAWCDSHLNTSCEYEIEEYIEGELYHCASIIQDGQIKLSFVSKYLNPCGEAFLKQKLLGSIILDQEDSIALDIKNFNYLIIKAMMPIEDCVTHHEIFRRKNGEFVFLEIANRVIEGGRVAEMFYDQFGLNLREIDYKLRLGINIEITPKIPEVYYAVIASIARKNSVIKKIFIPNIKSQYRFINMPTNNDKYFNVSWDLDIACNNLEIQIWNRDYQSLRKDFDSLKDFTLCEIEAI